MVPKHLIADRGTKDRADTLDISWQRAQIKQSRFLGDRTMLHAY